MPKVCRCSFDLQAIIRSVLLITVAAPFFCPPWEPNDRSWLGWATIPPNGGVMVRPRGQAATTICLLGNPGVGDGRDGVAEAQAQHKKKITRAWHGFGAIGKIAGGLTAFKLKRGSTLIAKCCCQGKDSALSSVVGGSGIQTFPSILAPAQATSEKLTSRSEQWPRFHPSAPNSQGKFPAYPPPAPPPPPTPLTS